MTSGPTPPIVSDAEIQAALAEAQAKATEIPSLDDGQGQHVVPVPIEPPAPPRPAAVPRPAATVAPAAPRASATPAAPAGPPATAPQPGWLSTLLAGLLGWLRIGKRKAAADAGARRSLCELLLRALDRFLTVVNRPFERLSPETRNLAGMLALVTIVVALGSLYLLPRLSPPRDALSQLARQRAAVEAAPATRDAEKNTRVSHETP